MIVKIIGAKCIGIDAVPVTIEVNICSGIGIHLVGLADIAVKESLLRTVTALQSLGFRIPGKKIVINLAPADLHKRGSGYDLSIAIGILAASGQITLPDVDKYLIMGELGLDGSVKSIAGALPYTELAISLGLKGCIFPTESTREVTDFAETDIFAVDSLTDALEILGNGLEKERFLIWNKETSACMTGVPKPEVYMDFSEIIGQDGAKRGLEIAAAGGHNVIMIGPPGSGKSSLAKALAGILPPMTKEESIMTSKIYSVAGKGLMRYGLMSKRPFRAPHYSASIAALVGGGSGDNILPGEVSLAQNGILFLDEFCELKKTYAEALRGPLEDRKVTISRLRSKIEYPASFMLVAAANPCPCGYYGESDRCSCTPGQRASYISKLSGPVMDRIDIHLWLHPVDPERLVSKLSNETSSEIRERVIRARNIQTERFAGEGIFSNAEMSNKLIRQYCPLSKECKVLITKIMEGKGLSARAFFRIVRLARTIADLQGKETLSPANISEAAGFRFLDKTMIE